jgi:phospholipase C
MTSCRMTLCKNFLFACFLALLSLLALTGCQGLGASPTPTPTPTATPSPTPTLQTSVNHVIIMIQENRSFDSYLGHMTAFRQQSSPPIPINSSDGKIRDLSDAVGFVNTSPAAGDIAPYRTGSVCTENLSPDWEEHHVQINHANPAAASPTNADMKGFVPVAYGESQAFDQQGIILDDQTGHRAMGFFDETQLNYYYFMAANFAMSDNLHSPIPANTTPNRMYLHGATSQGFAHIPTRLLTSKTIWQELDEKGVSWKIYVTDFTRSFKTYLSFFTYINQAGVQAKIVPLSQYFSDLQAGTLPSVSFIEAGYFSGQDEHTSNINPSTKTATPVNVQTGAAHVASILTPLLISSSWADSIFLFAFDEGGGAFDHVPPVAVPNPDGIPPQDLIAGKDVAGDFTMTGVRVPNMIVSPFAKKNFVSHTPMDYTAFLKLIETRFGLSPLTARDASMPDMTEFFDFTNGGPWAVPPVPPAQRRDGVCDFTLE